MQKNKNIPHISLFKAVKYCNYFGGFQNTKHEITHDWAIPLHYIYMKVIEADLNTYVHKIQNFT
jgi:hypothetical protein